MIQKVDVTVIGIPEAECGSAVLHLAYVVFGRTGPEKLECAFFAAHIKITAGGVFQLFRIVKRANISQIGSPFLGTGPSGAALNLSRNYRAHACPCAYRRSARDRPYLNEYAPRDSTALLRDIARGRPAGQGMHIKRCGTCLEEGPVCFSRPDVYRFSDASASCRPLRYSSMTRPLQTFPASPRVLRDPFFSCVREKPG